jgi:2',3'-cyclic-nucleotide 2'-phosphodiesterase (5'-nucleotidase family)
VALVEKIRAESQDPVLVLDSGDLFFDKQAMQKNTKWALTKAQVISRAYMKMKFTAINVGDLDLQGLDFLRQEAEAGLPLISANLIDPSTKKPIFQTHRIEEVNGLRIAFFGLLSPKLPAYLQQALTNKAVVENPVDAARQVVEKLRDQADLIVLLSDLGSNNDRDLVAYIEGIHFVLGGHDGRMLRWPFRGGTAYIFQSYKKGMYVGNLRVIRTDPSAPFLNAGEADQIRQEIQNLDRRMKSITEASERNPKQKERFDKVIADLIRKKDILDKRLARVQQSAASGNRFFWNLDPLRMNMPEDEEVLGWVTKTGLTKD